MAATALGAGLAVIGVRALVSLAPADIPRIADAAVDLRVLGVALVVAVAAGLAFGMIPALQARRVDLQGSLKAKVVTAVPPARSDPRCGPRSWWPNARSR